MASSIAPAGAFRDLLLRYEATEAKCSYEVHEASLSACLASGDDPLRILSYLASIGIVVRALPDLLLINARDDEEELSAQQVAEGVAVTIASQGSWVLFLP